MLNENGILAAEDARMLLKQTENMLQRARDFDRKNRTQGSGRQRKRTQ